MRNDASTGVGRKGEAGMFHLSAALGTTETDVSPTEALDLNVDRLIGCRPYRARLPLHGIPSCMGNNRPPNSSSPRRRRSSNSKETGQRGGARRRTRDAIGPGKAATSRAMPRRAKAGRAGPAGQDEQRDAKDLAVCV